MTAALPTGPRGRLLALGLAIAVLGVVYVSVAAPLLDLYASRGAAADSRRAMLVKLNAIAAELPSLRARVAQLRAAVDSNKLTLEGNSDAIASAALQGHIEEMAGAAGITIGSTESLPATAQGAYRRLGLRIMVSGEYEGLIKLLASIEQATPPLVIDHLQIRSFQRRPGAALASALDASLEVYGFRLGDAAGVDKR